MAITSDNIQLSEPTPPAAATATNANPIGIACTDASVLHFIEAATAPNTRRAYDSDLREFLAWGGSLPASPDIVARYLAAHATTHAIATLARRLVAIRRGMPSAACPTRSGPSPSGCTA